jgi:hypothetical protein
MIAEQFERRTMAAMELALERVCERWSHGAHHEARKRVAKNVIRRARAGDAGLEALIEAGARVSSRRASNPAKRSGTSSRNGTGGWHIRVNLRFSIVHSVHHFRKDQR